VIWALTAADFHADHRHPEYRLGFWRRPPGPAPLPTVFGLRHYRWSRGTVIYIAGLAAMAAAQRARWL